MFGEISFNRAANEMYKSIENTTKPGQTKTEYELVKGLALLFRRELSKSDEMFDDQIMQKKIQQYVKQLTNDNQSSIDTDYIGLKET